MTATYCANHPDRETSLRCNRCNKYICPSCAVLTPTGYRCKECIREQKKVFDTAKPQDFVFGFIVATVLSYIGSLIAGRFGLFSFLVGPFAGMLIANIVLRVIGGRRSKALFLTTTVGVVIGGLINVFPIIYALLVYTNLQVLAALIWPGVYVLLATPAFYARISGIQIR
jgi:hypothetical protein